MKLNRTYFLFLTFSSTLLFSAEPSAFGAGDLTSTTPYGLTKNEKVLLETEKKLKRVASKSNSQASQLDSLRERLDGLQSIVESLSRKAHNNKINLQNQQNSIDVSLDSINEYQKRLGASVAQNKQEIEELKNIITKMNKEVETLSLDYVTKADYNSLVKDVNNFKILVAKEMKKGIRTKSKKSSIKSADLYNRAKANFNKKRYTAAINDYEELIRRQYKPAYSHYMIGEMYFKRRNYAKAISYFKKSSSLYSKASYMPKLMLHTGIAMLKTGDKKHANAFFDAVTVKYPNSKEAVEAEKYLGM